MEAVTAIFSNDAVLVGTPIIQQNDITEYRNGDFKSLFIKLTGKEIKDLKPNKPIFVFSDHLHPTEYVTGAIKVHVTRIQIYDEECKVFWVGGRWNGSIITKRGVHSNLLKATNEERLHQLVLQNPLATVIGDT